MIALLQRVSSANVVVDNQLCGEIDKGILVLLAVEPADNQAKAKRLAERVAGYRIFEDANGKMNLNVEQAGGDLLVVSQFTLAADTSSGMRPSFTTAAEPKMSNELYEYFCQCLRERGFSVPTGKFGADMKVSLTNDGPVTFRLTI